MSDKAQTKRAPMRWARGKTESRTWGVPSWELRRAGQVLARVQRDRTSGLWFWYGFGRNTATNMRELEAVKAEAIEFARSQPESACSEKPRVSPKA